MSKRLMCLMGLLAVVAMSTMLVGCPPKDVEEPDIASPVDEPADGPGDESTDVAGDVTWTVGFSNATWEDPWREVQNKEMQLEADKHPEIDLKIADGQNDNGKQIETVESFLEQGIDLLIISPREADALASVVKKVYVEKGIPVIIIDRSVTYDPETEEPPYTCFIGGDNRQIGAAAAELVKKHFGDEPAAIVEIEGIPDATATLDRKAGFEDGIADSSNLEIVFDQPADYKRAPAVEAMTAALTGNQKVDCVYAHNDEMALGAYQAAKSVGRDGEMIIIGIDAVQTEAIKAVMDGNMFATYFYPTCGKDAIEVALRILNGEEVEKEIILDTTEITAENAEQYYDEDSTLVIQG